MPEETGFEWALEHAVLSSFEAGTYASHDEWIERKKESPVRIQWDPERSLALVPLPYRSLQVGLSGEAVHKYVHEWISGITDVTANAHRIRDLVAAGDRAAAKELLPPEQPYELPDRTRRRLGIIPESPN